MEPGCFFPEPLRLGRCFMARLFGEVRSGLQSWSLLVQLLALGRFQTYPSTSPSRSGSTQKWTRPWRVHHGCGMANAHALGCRGCVLPGASGWFGNPRSAPCGTAGLPAHCLARPHPSPFSKLTRQNPILAHFFSHFKEKGPEMPVSLAFVAWGRGAGRFLGPVKAPRAIFRWGDPCSSRPQSSCRRARERSAL